jgi:hypothetical protein
MASDHGEQAMYAGSGAGVIVSVLVVVFYGLPRKKS